MAKRQIVCLEVTTAGDNGAPADWNWGALLDSNGADETVRVIAAGPIQTIALDEEEER